jgi:hypothetical protein
LAFGNEKEKSAARKQWRPPPAAALRSSTGATAIGVRPRSRSTPRAIFGLSASTIPRSIRPAALAASKR